MTKQIQDNIKVEVKKLEAQIHCHQVNHLTFFGNAKVREIARLNSCKQRLEVLKRIMRS